MVLVKIAKNIVFRLLMLFLGLAFFVGAAYCFAVTDTTVSLASVPYSFLGIAALGCCGIFVCRSLAGD